MKIELTIDPKALRLGLKCNNPLLNTKNMTMSELLSQFAHANKKYGILAINNIPTCANCPIYDGTKHEECKNCN